MIKLTKIRLAALFLSWANDFISVAGFAEHHGLTRNRTLRIIRLGRIIHERRSHSHGKTQQDTQAHPPAALR